MKICLMCRKRNIEHYGICPDCAELNRQMRERFCDLTGRFALITGGRIKIGYAVCLRLLRRGASVIAVTRYPRSALENYMKEPDYEKFKDRLYIIGFDLLHVDKIDELIRQILSISGGKLDILINNAAQTVKKSADYYAALEAHEKALSLTNENLLPIPVTGNVLSIADTGDNSPCDYGETDLDNSWVRKPENISVREMLEVQLINVTAPFLLTNGLRSALSAASGNKFVVNVSSVEGRFNTKQKLARHVHTNMAKASLNMMTHSLAADYARDKIFVYSCDPGWVSNQFPPGYEISKSFEPYLSPDDGAARVLYPVTKNLNAEKVTDFGAFYKDYRLMS